MTRSQRTNNGFTVTELVVLIAIGAVLTGLVLPDMNQARSKLLREACAANLHQWGMAIELYLSDYNDSFWPCSNPWTNINNPYANYLVGIDPGSTTRGTGAGARERRMRNCPAYVATGPESSITMLGPVTYAFVRPNANIPGVGWAAINTSGGRYTLSLKTVVRPDQFMLIMDAPVTDPITGGVVFMVTSTDALCTSGICHDFFSEVLSITNRHSGGVNVLFGDQHVAFEPLAELQRQSNFGTLSAWFAAERPADTNVLIRFNQ
jgi:prepilin-type processing-associated H-X9-DG protein